MALPSHYHRTAIMTGNSRGGVNFRSFDLADV
jgi:hypothetical protein